MHYNRCMDIHYEVVGAIFISDGKVLAFKRGASSNPLVAYKWEFAGGKVERGEDEKSALERELKEELNLTCLVKDKFMTTDYTYPKYSVRLHLYRCDMLSDFTLREHVACRWMAAEELNQDEWAPADIPVIDRLKSELASTAK